MRKLKGVVQIVVAIGLAFFLVVGWDFLGGYYVTLKFLPDVPLFGARLLIGLAVIGLIISGARDLRREADESEPIRWLTSSSRLSCISGIG